MPFSPMIWSEVSADSGFDDLAMFRTMRPRSDAGMPRPLSVTMIRGGVGQEFVQGVPKVVVDVAQEVDGVRQTAYRQFDHLRRDDLGLRGLGLGFRIRVAPVTHGPRPPPHWRMPQ